MSKLDDIFKKLDSRIINGIVISVARDESYDTDPMLNDAKAEVKDLFRSIVVKPSKLPKSNDQQAIKQGFNFYHKELIKRINEL